jgi:hypothetical protein
MPELHVARELEIARPPADVFAFLVEMSNWSKLDKTVVHLEPLTALAVGSNGTVTNKRAGGLRATTRWEITELVPGQRFTNRIVGAGYELCETVDLTATTTGTNLSVTDRLTSTGPLGWLMVPLSGGVIRRDLERRSARLKALLEGGHTA